MKNAERNEPVLKKLASRLRERFKESQVSLDEPASERGVWHLDLRLEDQTVTVQWQPGKPLGISSRADVGYGEGPDESYPDIDSAYARVVSLLLARTHTRPPVVRDLSALRREVGMSQMELAEALSVNQAAISKLERRDDIKLSTLKAVVNALGATLDIRARFPDGSARSIEFLVRGTQTGE